MKVCELIALLADADQEAEVFSITGQGCPMQYEVKAVAIQKDFSEGHVTGEYDVVRGRARASMTNEAFLIEGPIVRIWRPKMA